jgi:hypothetical protein
VIREWRVVSDRPMRWRQWISAGACKEQVASGRNDRNQTKRLILARKSRNYRGPWETDILGVEMLGVVWRKRLLEEKRLGLARTIVCLAAAKFWGVRIALSR